MSKRLLIVFVMFSFLMPVSAFASGWTKVDAPTVKRMMEQEDALVVFPLSRIEYNNLHIVDSVNIPLGRLKKMLPGDMDRKLVFYCLGPKCTASPKAADVALSLGYRNVYAFIGGLPEWSAAGYPTRTIDALPDIKPPSITPEELKRRIELDPELVLLDVRQPHDRSKGVIEAKQQVYIPLDDLYARRREVPRGKHLVVCCQKGKRAPTAARYLLGKYFENVVILRGGVKGWKEAGYPVGQ